LILRAVVDTNVVVSGLLSAQGPPARVLDLVRNAELAMLIDDRILEEYRVVLARPKFRPAIHPAQAEAFLALCSLVAVPVLAAPLDIVYPHAADAPFLEVAVAGHACALVTGNVKHFPPTPGLRILAPTDFLEYYATTTAQQR
jgi:putative PIN family toxin of toxin-antitoxin system